MPLNTNKLLQATFAQNPTDGAAGITDIPLTDATENIVSQIEGAGEALGKPFGSGGEPITRPQFNGAFNLYSNRVQLGQQLAPYPYLAEYETAIGGYKEGAVVIRTDGRIVRANFDLLIPTDPNSSANMAETNTGNCNWALIDGAPISINTQYVFVRRDTLSITAGYNEIGSIYNHITLNGKNVAGSTYSIIWGDETNDPSANDGRELTASETATNPTGLTGGNSYGLYYTVVGQTQGQGTRLAFANDVSLLQGDLQGKINTLNDRINLLVADVVDDGTGYTFPSNWVIVSAVSKAVITIVMFNINPGSNILYSYQWDGNTSEWVSGRTTGNEITVVYYIT